MIKVNESKVYLCVSLILCSLWLAAGQTGMGSLSMEARQELLDAHNLFRGIVAPPASNMQRMVSIIIIIISYNHL